MGRTAYTELQCLYTGAIYLLHYYMHVSSQLHPPAEFLTVKWKNSFVAVGNRTYNPFVDQLCKLASTQSLLSFQTQIN